MCLHRLIPSVPRLRFSNLRRKCLLRHSRPADVRYGNSNTPSGLGVGGLHSFGDQCSTTWMTERTDLLSRAFFHAPGTVMPTCERTHRIPHPNIDLQAPG